MRFTVRIVALILAVQSSWVFAAGFYVGVNGLLSSLQGKIESSGSVNNVVNFIVTTNPNTNLVNEIFANFLTGPGVAFENSQISGMDNTSLGIGGILGYTVPINERFSIAMQLDAEVNGGNTQYLKQDVALSQELLFDGSPIVASMALSEKSPGSFGISLLPEWHINFNPYPSSKRAASLLFLAGYRYGKFDSELQASSFLTGNTNSKSTTWRSGGELGIGAQVSLSNTLGIRLMSSKVFYQKKAIFKEFSNTWMAHSTIQKNQLLLSLIWKL